MSTKRLHPLLFIVKGNVGKRHSWFGAIGDPLDPLATAPLAQLQRSFSAGHDVHTRSPP